jgi:hypothetical protein
VNIALRGMSVIAVESIGNLEAVPLRQDLVASRSDLQIYSGLQLYFALFSLHFGGLFFHDTYQIIQSFYSLVYWLITVHQLIATSPFARHAS